MKSGKNNTDNKTLLKVSDLSVTFGDQTVLEDISFSVKTGDVVVILGPNGAGKSTLLKALLGLVAFNGTVDWRAQKIGYLPTQESLARNNLPPLTVHDFFSFKSQSSKQIIRMLDKVGLEKKVLTKQFATLSTGQFQRMMLAWVLIDEPSVLLLDEPTAGIDIGGEETVYSLLHRLWKEWNLTILLVTHNISIIWKHATDILCLNKKLICYGPPEQTLTADLLKNVYGVEVSVYEHRHPV